MRSASPRSRRRRSIALRRAVVVIQAPGLAGTPSRGQVATAAAKASCSASSARLKSPTWRMSVARIAGPSSLKALAIAAISHRSLLSPGRRP